MVQGSVLFETLLLSMRQYPFSNSHRIPDSQKDDRPAWEMDNPFLPERNTPFGYLDFLTWQSRRIKLVKTDVAGDSLKIQQTYLTQGLSIGDGVLDPLKSYRLTKKGEPIPQSFGRDEVLWRDSIVLFELTDTDPDNSPQNFKLLSDLLRFKVLARKQQFHYLALGLVTGDGGAGSADFWRYERMPLPLAYLDDSASVEQLQKALDLAKSAHWRLTDARDWFAWLWLKPNRYDNFDEWQKSSDYTKRNGNASFTTLRDRLTVSQRFWWRLDQPFTKIMPRLAQDLAEAQQAILEWREVLKQTARSALNEITDGLEESPRTLRAIAKAQEQLERGLGIVLKIQEGGQP
jgi:CRISPR system Cascade subunit CasA